MPSHRLELALGQVSGRPGVDGMYMVTSTSIVASIGPSETSQNFLVRCPPRRINRWKRSAR